jgi:cystathionine beta-lyase
LDDLITSLLPAVNWQPSEATYLAWLDARGTGMDDPATEALTRAKVMVNRGSTFGDGPEGLDRYRGFVRVNFGTSAERLDRVMKSLADAWVSR